MSITKAKIKQLEKELAIQEDKTVHICFRDYKTGIYYSENKGKRTEYKTVEEFKKDNGVGENSTIFLITDYMNADHATQKGNVLPSA